MTCITFEVLSFPERLIKLLFIHVVPLRLREYTLKHRREAKARITTEPTINQ